MTPPATSGAGDFHRAQQQRAARDIAAAVHVRATALDAGEHLPQIPGNGIRPGDARNPFGRDTKAWYEIHVLNNPEDSGLAAGIDTDARVIVRATGYGPGGSVARVEWEVMADGPIGLGRPCPGYAQGNLGADGAGVNDCERAITDQVGIFNPNTP